MIPPKGGQGVQFEAVGSEVHIILHTGTTEEATAWVERMRAQVADGDGITLILDRENREALN